MSDFEKWIHNKFNVPLEEKLEGKVISLLDYADMKEAWDARGVEESKPGPCGKHPNWAWVEDRVVIGAAGQNRMTVPGHCLICTADAEARREALSQVKAMVEEVGDEAWPFPAAKIVEEINHFLTTKVAVV